MSHRPSQYFTISHNPLNSTSCLPKLVKAFKCIYNNKYIYIYTHTCVCCICLQPYWIQQVGWWAKVFSSSGSGKRLQFANWKITCFKKTMFIAKSTISMGHGFQFATSFYDGLKHQDPAAFWKMLVPWRRTMTSWSGGVSSWKLPPKKNMIPTTRLTDDHRKSSLYTKILDDIDVSRWSWCRDKLIWPFECFERIICVVNADPLVIVVAHRCGEQLVVMFYVQTYLYILKIQTWDSSGMIWSWGFYILHCLQSALI